MLITLRSAQGHAYYLRTNEAMHIENWKCNLSLGQHIVNLSAVVCLMILRYPDSAMLKSGMASIVFHP
ncbi:hypothetical protein [Lyngbya aestuarii]|uniref:hypothetical protein n=1 Tax=Lyngbya aestuarii TaxID=118322 RepID=UPI00403E0E1D